MRLGIAVSNELNNEPVDIDSYERGELMTWGEFKAQALKRNGREGIVWLENEEEGISLPFRVNTEGWSDYKVSFEGPHKLLNLKEFDSRKRWTFKNSQCEIFVEGVDCPGDDQFVETCFVRVFYARKKNG